MITTIEDVPEDYRHMFYPPRRIDINFKQEGAQIAPDFFASPDIGDKLQKMFFEILTGTYVEPPAIPDEIKLLRRLKYGYIMEGDKRYITYVDNETMKAYRLKDDSYYEGLLCPLEEIENFTFERWCRGMDL